MTVHERFTSRVKFLLIVIGIQVFAGKIGNTTIDINHTLSTKIIHTSLVFIANRKTKWGKIYVGDHTTIHFSNKDVFRKEHTNTNKVRRSSDSCPYRVS